MRVHTFLIHAFLVHASILALFGCSGDPAPAPTNTEDCGGLGCPSCGGLDLTNPKTEICQSSVTCTADADCTAMLDGDCVEDLGTFTTDFFPAGCVGGVCVHHVVKASCPDHTTCSDCTEQGKSQACHLEGSAAACADCCAGSSGSTYAVPFFQACACGAGMPCESACSKSRYCGGQGPETDTCAACLKGTLRDGGACVASSDFQSACIHMQGSNACQILSQCLATCPTP
ncbi:hypothetical protein [Polyangium mundeleinium]|uniref:TNFR-Cys domain-containing protein n=1 Tax=Polyangium mundeleinium TaxID=2995306 RepID=A0ABT5EZB3_9BACT|nr:hypothetical protein [Polyangium mundeleinium]MDC0747182.1 hypothetical protein [Polyangium mundeleinium]